MTNTEAREGEGRATVTVADLVPRTRIHGVTDAIEPGTILIEDSAPLPSSVLLRADAYCRGWSAVTDERSVFEKEVGRAGLTFFFLAGEMKATVFGFDRQKALRGALSRLTANTKAQDCNSIEITRITGKSFLGVPYVSVYAHPRHLQKGLVFAGRR